MTSIHVYFAVSKHTLAAIIYQKNQRISIIASYNDLWVYCRQTLWHPWRMMLCQLLLECWIAQVLPVCFTTLTSNCHLQNPCECDSLVLLWDVQVGRFVSGNTDELCKCQLDCGIFHIFPVVGHPTSSTDHISRTFSLPVRRSLSTWLMDTSKSYRWKTRVTDISPLLPASRVRILCITTNTKSSKVSNLDSSIAWRNAMPSTL